MSVALLDASGGAGGPGASSGGGRGSCYTLLTAAAAALAACMQTSGIGGRRKEGRGDVYGYIVLGRASNIPQLLRQTLLLFAQAFQPC